jgi:DNA-binding MarR family transcriptional regulator
VRKGRVCPMLNARRMVARDDAKLLLAPDVVEQLAKDFPDDDVTGMQLFRSLRILARQMNETTGAQLAALGVSAKKFNYLAALHGHRKKGLTSSDLGALVRTTSGSVTVMLDALEREGLIARYANPADGRSIVIKLTSKGAQLYMKAAAIRHKLVGDVVSKLGRDRAARFIKLIVDTGNALYSVTNSSE